MPHHILDLSHPIADKAHLFATIPLDTHNTQSLMATLKAPARLPELIKAAFAKALAEGDLSYFPTHVQDVPVGALTVSVIPPSLAAHHACI